MEIKGERMKPKKVKDAQMTISGFLDGRLASWTEKLAEKLLAIFQDGGGPPYASYSLPPGDAPRPPEAHQRHTHRTQAQHFAALPVPL